MSFFTVLFVFFCVLTIIALVFSVLGWKKARNHDHHYIDVRGLEQKIKNTEPAEHQHVASDIVQDASLTQRNVFGPHKKEEEKTNMQPKEAA